MTATRTFLGWNEAPLASACRWLLKHHPGAGLSALIIVTPGGRAGRLLEGMLIDAAAAKRVPFTPPLLKCTPGEVPGAILRVKGRLATTVQRRFAWARAITSTPNLEALIPHTPTDDVARLSIAGVLERCHNELIGEGLVFKDVAARHPEPRETDRWLAAAAVQRRYQSELADVGLVDEGLARLEALDSPAAPQSLILIGVPDLGAVAQRALRKPGLTVESLIFAPEELADRFDDLGCIKPDRWENHYIPLREDSIIFADDPADQARHCIEALAGLNSASIHDITIGIPDDSVAPHIARAAERYAGAIARPASGSPIASSPVYQLLAACERLLEEDSFDALAALVRVPDMERYLLRQFNQGRVERWLIALDSYAANHLPGGLDAPLLGTSAMVREQLSKLLHTIGSLLEPLRRSSPGPNDLLAVLQRIYAGLQVRREDPRAQSVVRASRAIAAAATHIAALPPSWHPRTGAALIHAILDAIESERLPPPAASDALELLGWLELPLDPAPFTIITGVNDGFIPEAFSANALLTDSLRERLGIPCSRSRLARDTYLLTVLANSRRVLKLICGRRAADGDPLFPCRLLFATDSATTVERIRRFCDRTLKPRPVITPHRQPGEINLFESLPYIEAPPITSMRVTSFRIYIQSPYLFYLQHVLNLREHEGPEHELDPRAFGIVIHSVLQQFAGTDDRDSTDPRRIQQCLWDLLAAESTARFGPAPSISIAVQMEMARLRLAEFAAWQAGHRAQGWSIVAAEWKPEHELVPLPGTPEPFHIRGTIDRIDHHDNGDVAILDYKTNESVRAPEKTHTNSGQWIDLQLPLYRHLAAERKLPADPSKLTLGYIALPGMPGKVGLLKAPWTAKDLDAADDAARKVVASVLKSDFRRLGDSPAEVGTFAALSGTALAAPTGEPREKERPDA